MATSQSTTTGASAQNTPAHTSLSFVKVEHFGKRNQKLTSWFAVPDEPYEIGNATGYKVAAEFMAWLQTRPNDYITGLFVRDVISAACGVLAEPCSPVGTHCKRGAAVSFLDGMAACLMFAATRSNHQAYLAGQAQRSEDWAKESAQMEAERNRATGQRLAAARKARREARMAGTEVAQ